MRREAELQHSDKQRKKAETRTWSGQRSKTTFATLGYGPCVAPRDDGHPWVEVGNREGAVAPCLYWDCSSGPGIALVALTCSVARR